MFESRAELRPGRLEALWPLLSERARAHPAQLCHQVLWQLFADTPERTRDFLFHVERQRPLCVILRSTRPPADALGLWDIRTYPFQPQLHAGQSLRFRLECVATRTRPMPGAKRGKRQDVAVHAWKSLPAAEQIGRTPEDFAESAGLAWLTLQEAAAGFRCDSGSDAMQMLGYRRHRLPTPGGGQPLTFGSLIFAGTLEVTAPDLFVAALGRGFGAARAFGFGLMQVAPVLDGLDL